jgi:exopolyphosphatase/guanosine-5'-triphosphate,3'-diphosphate pyrophosphatase
VKSKTLAAIDIGTNTFRLLIAEVQPKVYKKNDYNIKEIYSERIITRLGQGILEKQLFKKEAIDRSIDVLKKFSDTISRHHVHKTSAVATSALREAKNKGKFLRIAKETTGLEIKIISGREEAKKTFLGMLIGITMPETALMVDIGGGSTELIFTKSRKPLLVYSLNLGVVYLADKHMKKDPPLMKDLNQMGNEISQKIMLIVKLFAKLFSKNTVFIGTAGTVTALAAITQNLTKYEHSKIHNSKITIEKVRDIFSNISTITAKERAKYYALEPARLDIIVPGILILLKLMETFGFKEVIVSDYGLREGIILDLYRKTKT